MINDGLFYYEEDLWKDDEDDDWIESEDGDETLDATLVLNDSNSGSLGGRSASKTNVNVISQEDFAKLRSTSNYPSSSNSRLDSSKVPRSSSSPPRMSDMTSSTPVKKTVPMPMAGTERFMPKQPEEKEDLEETLKARGVMIEGNNSSSDPVPTSDINTSRRDHHNHR